MLSNELQRFINEINSDNNKTDIITYDDITFVICHCLVKRNVHEFWVKRFKV